MKSLEKIRKAMDSYDKIREKVIQGSRKTIQASKTSIYATHRDEMSKASDAIDQMRVYLVDLKKLVSKEPRLGYEGIYKVAIQEFVEALALYEFVSKGTVLTYNSEFGDYENYLLGLCDLSGELVRKAINSSIKEDYKMAVKIRKTLEELYTELSKFDLKNGELRRKYDGIKYDVKKLDDLVFQLKMKDKI